MQVIGDKIIRILLITNRNSDNLGDKLIEICDLSLVNAVMNNLDLKNYEIESVDTGFAMKEGCENSVHDADIILFGGAPVFNYAYQNFYNRTIAVIRMAEQYNKPVLFSAIGIESYDENNHECMQLKEAVNSDCVKQVTTRDGYEFLEKYRSNQEIPIAKVSDPVVFAERIFDNFLEREKTIQKKKIGIFVLRASGFTDNEIDFPEEKVARMWQQLAEELERRGYDYEFLTSGHFQDEAFLEELINKYGINSNKCVFNMDTPEKMVSKISSYDGVVSCRLHPSVTSYALKTPSVGIVWNTKVSYFYEAIGYPDRLLSVKGITGKSIADKLEMAINQGVERDNSYEMTVYQSLLLGFCRAMGINEKSVDVFNYEELMKNLQKYKGTSNQERQANLERKFQRIYVQYNRRTVGYCIIYNSGVKSDNLLLDFDTFAGKIKYLKSGTVEYWSEELSANDGKSKLLKNGFTNPGYEFVGWRIRVKHENGKWFWIAKNETLIPKDFYADSQKQKKIFKEEGTIPFIPISAIDVVVAEAVWKKEKTGEEQDARR